jgi:cyclic pyranopterin phosphate synthase
VLTVAEIAGIQGAKRTGELIPLRHPPQLWKIDVKCTLQENGVQAECTTLCFGKTGVEMEALTGVNIDLLTVNDMCKAVDKEMVIENIHLVSKTKAPLPVPRKGKALANDSRLSPFGAAC